MTGISTGFQLREFKKNKRKTLFNSLLTSFLVKDSFFSCCYLTQFKALNQRTLYNANKLFSHNVNRLRSAKVL